MSIMSWQDIIIAVGQWIFLIALLPSIVSKNKPALSTSILTGTVLGVFAFTYATLGFWTSTISTILVSGAWITLAVQKYLLDKHVKGGVPKDAIIDG